MITQKTTRRAVIWIAVLLGVGVGSARAQTDTDITAVTAANNAFYTALSSLDAASMEKVLAREAYVATIGPRSTAVEIGSDVVQNGFKNFMATLAQLTVKPVDTQVHVNGNVAWTIGRETAEGKLKNGTSISGTNFVSNVFEKKDGRWLLVLHHAQRIPQ